MSTKLEFFEGFVVAVIVFLLIIARRERVKIVPSKSSLFLFIFKSPQGKTVAHNGPSIVSE